MEAMEEDPCDSQTPRESEKGKRLASPALDDEHIAKRIRASSPQGELQIDLDNIKDSTAQEEEQIPSFSRSRWANKFPIRTGSGKLELVPIRTRKPLESKTTLWSGERPSLLGKPFWDLFLEAEAELERIKQTHLETSNENVVLPEQVAGVESTRPKERRSLDGKEQKSQLWTDKYRAEKFRDLLSDAALNRVLLRWLKLWDALVFDKEVKKKQTPFPETQDDKKGYFQKDQLPELILELDKSRRPMQPVVLLAGPPGLGKTTLAHVLAVHSGYNVVELNASDDRSPDAFQSALEGATQMKSVLDKNCRPNCLVIDEIDGAPSQSINVLLKMLKPEVSNETKNKKKKPNVLLRPVICICNDPWGPALRQLRQNAILIQMPPIQSQRLSARLQEVLLKERMKFDSAALKTLAEKTGNDVRSCLSTLQFIHSKKGEVNMKDVNTASIGNKDTQQSLSNVLRGIFTKPRESVRQQKTIGIPSLAQSFGDYERLNQALFDTYVSGQGFDTELSHKVPLSAEWLSFADIMQHVMQSTQNYALMAYGPFTAARFHTLHATYKGAKLVMNNSSAENYQKVQKSKQHIASVLSASSATIISHFSASNILLEVLPYVLGIMQPSLGSFNIQLLKDEDKVKFRSAIDVMTAFGLIYQQRHIDGRFSFQLEPDIEEIVRFPGIEQSFTPLPYASKLMFSPELELQKVRNSGDIVSSTSVMKKGPKSLPQTTGRAKPLAEKPRKDFFGRLIQPKEGSSSGNSSGTKTSSAASDNEKSQIYFKFKEGFSNAVRKNLKISQIL